MNIKINKRLKTVADMVKPGSVVADIGCDHAYLPIYLIKNNIASSVVASDINEGPCETARENIRAHGLADKINVVRTDGLCGIESFAPDTIIICGMGGDLISRIVKESEYTRLNRPNLILQPMTKAPVLRRELVSSGYAIIKEELVYDDRLYEVISARYDEIKREADDFKLLTGGYKPDNPLYEMHMEKLIKQYKTIVQGKTKSGADCTKERNILIQLEKSR